MCVNCAQTGYALADSVGLGQTTTKFLSLATAAVLMFSFAAPQAAPTKSIKAGAACSKVNAKSVVNNKTFVCKKSGKKLVWKVQNKKTKPANSAAPTNPIITPKPTEPVKELTRLEKIYQRLNNETSQFQQADLRIKTVISPKVRTERVAEIHARYEKQLQYLGKGVTKPVTMVFFDETEKDWWQQQVKIQEGPNGSLSWWGDGHCPINPNQICGYGSKHQDKQIYYHLVGSRSVWQNWHQHVVDHEVVHMWQGVLTPSLGVICWAVEGQANGLGYALSYPKTQASVNQERNMQIKRIGDLYSGYRSFTKADWVKVLTEINTNPGCYQKGFGYSFGMLAFEAMYEEYGYQKVSDFTISLSKTQSISQAATTSFGVSVTQLYELIAEYAVAAIKAAS